MKTTLVGRNNVNNNIYNRRNELNTNYRFKFIHPPADMTEVKVMELALRQYIGSDSKTVIWSMFLT